MTPQSKSRAWRVSLLGSDTRARSFTRRCGWTPSLPKHTWGRFGGGTPCLQGGARKGAGQGLFSSGRAPACKAGSSAKATWAETVKVLVRGHFHWPGLPLICRHSPPWWARSGHEIWRRQVRGTRGGVTAPNAGSEPSARLSRIEDASPTEVRSVDQHSRVSSGLSTERAKCIRQGTIRDAKNRTSQRPER